MICGGGGTLCTVCGMLVMICCGGGTVWITWTPGGGCICGLNGPLVVMMCCCCCCWGRYSAALMIVAGELMIWISFGLRIC